MMDKNCPCTMNCPNRPNCRDCEPFKRYREEKNKEYAERLKQSQVAVYIKETSNRLVKRCRLR